MSELQTTMMGRIRAGLTSVLLVMASVTVCPQRAGAEAPSGALYVTTLPSGADVWVDGTYVGRAPVLVDALPVGHHSLTITKTGWVVQEVDVRVASGATEMSSTHLVAGPRALAGDAAGTLVLRSLPPGAELELDGVSLSGPIPQGMTIPAGRHRLTATTARGKVTRSVTILPDTSTEVVMSEPREGDTRSAIVAPAEDYLPTNNFSVEGNKVVVRYGGHLVVGYLGARQVRVDGTTTSYDGAPQTIDGKLYLPLALLEKLADDSSNGH